MAGLDGAVLDGVEHLQSGDDLTRGEPLDLELAAGGRGDALLGKLEARRHLTSGPPCAIAGATPAARMPAIPAPAVLMNFLRSIWFLLWE